MPRTTEAAVREIIGTSLTTSQIIAFIADANLFVTEEVAAEDVGISAERLELIERYLAAALIRLRDLGLASVTWSKVSEQYQVDPMVTDYLKRAAAFDPTGKIKGMFLPSEGGFKARFRVGETFSEDASDPPNTEPAP